MIVRDLQAEIIRRLSSTDQPAHHVVESLFEELGSADSFYAQLFSVLADVQLDDDAARRHFHKLVKHRTDMEHRLGRPVDFRVALLDYFTNNEPMLVAPKIVELRTYESNLRLATIDELTGLYNRRFLESYLDRELNRARRYGQQFSAVFVDLDDFKQVNDSYGHAAGDAVLQCFSRMLRGYLRREDIAARYGGEEFVIVMPQTPSAGALTLARRVLHSLKTTPCTDDVQITFSAGVATYPEHGYGIVELLKNADAALYEAKLAGKSQVRLSSVEKRASRRYEATVPVECYAADRLVGVGTACDVSLSGISLETDSLLQPGSLLRLTVHGVDQDTAYEVSTRVVWAQKRDKHYRLGVRWESASAETIRALVSRVSTP